MLAHKNGCVVWSARQGISIKDACYLKLIQKIGYVTTISDQNCTVGQGNVLGVCL